MFGSAVGASVVARFSGVTTKIAVDAEQESSAVDVSDDNFGASCGDGEPAPGSWQEKMLDAEAKKKQLAARPKQARMPIPVVVHGGEIKGKVVLTAPPGHTRRVAGLSLVVRCVRVAPPPEKKGMFGMPSTEPKVPSAMTYSKIYTSEPLVLLAPDGSYDVTGDVEVPFAFPTARLPDIESVELENACGVWHWLEARVQWRGPWNLAQKARSKWWGMMEEAHGEPGNPMSSPVSHLVTDSYMHIPGAGFFGAAVQRFCLQVVTPPDDPLLAALQSAKGGQPWLTVADFGGQCKLELLHDGGVVPVGEHGGELAAKVTVSGTDAPLKRVEVRLITKLTGGSFTQPGTEHVTRTVLYDKEAADTLAAADKAAKAEEGEKGEEKKEKKKDSGDGGEGGDDDGDGDDDAEEEEGEEDEGEEGEDEDGDAASGDAADGEEGIVEVPTPIVIDSTVRMRLGGGGAAAADADADAGADDAAVGATEATETGHDALLRAAQLQCRSRPQPPKPAKVGVSASDATDASVPPPPASATEGLRPLVVEHLLQLRLISTEKVTDDKAQDKGDEKQAWNSVKVQLVRTAPSGVPVGRLAKAMPPPRPERPLWLQILIKIALFFLGILAFLITLSFIAPVKTKWAVGMLGVEEQAEYIGLIESKNATASWSARSVLAGGTQQLRRFLGSGGRRF